MNLLPAPIHVPLEKNTFKARQAKNTLMYKLSLLQPFDKGNEQLLTLLHPQLCHIANLDFSPLNSLPEYWHNTVDELCNMEETAPTELCTTTDT